MERMHVLFRLQEKMEILLLLVLFICSQQEGKIYLSHLKINSILRDNSKIITIGKSVNA